MLCLLYAPSPVNTMPETPSSARKIPDFSKRKGRQSRPGETKTEDAYTSSVSSADFSVFSAPSSAPSMTAKYCSGQFVADTLPLRAFLPHNLWIEVPFHGKSTHFDKLYDNWQAGDRSIILDICEIPGVDVDDLRQCLARQMLCTPCGFYIGTESFKTGAIFDVRHIASPTYIVYFILCLWNVAICV